MQFPRMSILQCSCCARVRKGKRCRKILSSDWLFVTHILVVRQCITTRNKHLLVQSLKIFSCIRFFQNMAGIKIICQVVQIYLKEKFDSHFGSIALPWTFSMTLSRPQDHRFTVAFGLCAAGLGYFAWRQITQMGNLF